MIGFWENNTSVLSDILPRPAFIVKGDCRVVKVIANRSCVVACKASLSAPWIRAKIRAIVERLRLFRSKDSLLRTLSYSSNLLYN